MVSSSGLNHSICRISVVQSSFLCDVAALVTCNARDGDIYLWLPTHPSSLCWLVYGVSSRTSLRASVRECSDRHWLQFTMFCQAVGASGVFFLCSMNELFRVRERHESSSQRCSSTFFLFGGSTHPIQLHTFLPYNLQLMPTRHASLVRSLLVISGRGLS